MTPTDAELAVIAAEMGCTPARLARDLGRTWPRTRRTRRPRHRPSRLARLVHQLVTA